MAAVSNSYAGVRIDAVGHTDHSRVLVPECKQEQVGKLERGGIRGRRLVAAVGSTGLVLADRNIPHLRFRIDMTVERRLLQ